MGNFYYEVFHDDYDVEAVNHKSGKYNKMKENYNPEKIPPNFEDAYKHAFANRVGLDNF